MSNMCPINILRKYNNDTSGVVYSVAYTALSVLIERNMTHETGHNLPFQTHSVVTCSDSQPEKFPGGTSAVAGGYMERL